MNDVRDTTSLYRIVLLITPIVPVSFLSVTRTGPKGEVLDHLVVHCPTRPMILRIEWTKTNRDDLETYSGLLPHSST